MINWLKILWVRYQITNLETSIDEHALLIEGALQNMRSMRGRMIGLQIELDKMMNFTARKKA